MPLFRQSWWCKFWFDVNRQAFEKNVLVRATTPFQCLVLSLGLLLISLFTTPFTFNHQQRNVPLLAFTRTLGIKEKDILRLYSEFCKADIGGTGSIDMKEFFEFLEIESSQYNIRAFQLLAFECNQGKLTFEEFLVSAYNFCTQSRDTLVHFGFQIMSGGRSNLSLADIEAFAELLFTDPARVREVVRDVCDILAIDEKRKVSHCDWETFASQAGRLSTMLYPAFRLQAHLQKKVLYPRFWKRAAKKRLTAKRAGYEMDLAQEFLRLKAVSYCTLAPLHICCPVMLAQNNCCASLSLQDHLGVPYTELQHQDHSTPLISPPLKSHSPEKEKRRKPSKRASVATQNPTEERKKTTDSDGRGISLGARMLQQQQHEPSSRRRTSAYTASSPTVPGRRGSMFDGMDVYDPETAVDEAEAALHRHQGFIIPAASALGAGGGGSRVSGGSQVRRRSLEIQEKSRRASVKSANRRSSSTSTGGQHNMSSKVPRHNGAEIEEDEAAAAAAAAAASTLRTSGATRRGSSRIAASDSAPPNHRFTVY
jgi:hypothetical protein